MKMSDPQANVIYMNARHLGLSYADECLLQRLHAIDILPEEPSWIVSNIFDYIKQPSDTIRNHIQDLINKYRSELETIK